MSRVDGGMLVARCLKNEGIEYISALCGGHTNAILCACRAAGIRIIDTRHEEAAVAMASAWAEVTGRPGVAVVTAGPGAANAFSGVARAASADCPIIVMAGEASLHARDLGAPQEIDSLEYMRPVARWAKRPYETARIPEYVSAAFRHALSGRTGPVFLCFPADVLARQVEERGVTWPRGYRTDARPAGAPAAVEAAAALLEQADRPIVLSDRGIQWAGAADALRRFVETSGIPSYTGFMNRAPIPEDHPLAMGIAQPFTGSTATVGVQRADVVLAVGLHFDYNFGYGRAPFLAQDARVIHVDVDPKEIGRNRPVHVGIAGDPGLVLGQLAAAFDAKTNAAARQRWVAHLHEAQRKVDDELAPLLHSDEKPIHPARVWREIRDFLPGNATVLGDGGDCFWWGMSIVRVHQPGHFVKCSAELGGIGGGIPMAVAAKVARPEDPVLVFTGDGSFGFNGIEFDTAVRHHIPFVCVVATDGAWGMIKHGQVQRYGADGTAAVDLGVRPYEKMVEALGGYGQRVTEPDDIRPALERAFASGLPACVNVIMQGSVSAATPWLKALGQGAGK